MYKDCLGQEWAVLPWNIEQLKKKKTAAKTLQ